VIVLADGEQIFEGTPAELRLAAATSDDDVSPGPGRTGGEAEDSGGVVQSFEHAFVSFLRERGH